MRPPAAGAGIETTELARRLSLPLITFSGLGTMIGGGFYALLGEVTAVSGLAAPLAFLASALLALFSAVSFAELSARLPYSAGEAHYVREAFGSRGLALGTGVLVILTGIVSAAALSRAVAGFLFDLAPFSPAAYVILIVLVLALVAAWGITESALLAAAITLIEVGGLVVVLFLKGDHLLDLGQRWPEFLAPPETGWMGLVLGAFLAFYAYVGFEDMVNVAEEVREPSRNLPIAILLSLGITTLLYAVVCVTALLVLSPDELGETHTPLARLVADEGAMARRGLALVSVLAGVNGALVQIIMAARIVYGLGRKERRIRWLAHVHPKTRTPVRATASIGGLVLILALWLPLVRLATITSGILLAVFALVNLALWVIKGRTPRSPQGPTFPRWVPLAGFVTCCGFLLLRIWEPLAR